MPFVVARRVPRRGREPPPGHRHPVADGPPRAHDPRRRRSDHPRLRPRGQDRRGRRRDLRRRPRAASSVSRSRSSSAWPRTRARRRPRSRSATSTPGTCSTSTSSTGSRAPSCTTGCTKAECVAREARCAYANGVRASEPGRGDGGRGGGPREGDAAAVVTRLTLRDGSVVHHEVRLAPPVPGVGGRGLPAATRARRLTRAVPIPGLLLTGGAQLADGRRRRRRSVVDGEPLAIAPRAAPRPRCATRSSRSARATRRCPGRRDPTGARPARGARRRRDAVAGHRDPVLLLACDLPFVDARAAARRLATSPGDGTVVPVDRDGIVQPVCARYSAAMRSTGPGSCSPTGSGRCAACCDETEVTRLADVDDRALVDVDTPDDARRWGIRRPGSLDP